jgi:hypothetical protein
MIPSGKAIIVLIAVRGILLMRFRKRWLITKKFGSETSGRSPRGPFQDNFLFADHSGVDWRQGRLPVLIHNGRLLPICPSSSGEQCRLQQ